MLVHNNIQQIHYKTPSVTKPEVWHLDIFVLYTTSYKLIKGGIQPDSFYSIPIIFTQICGQ